MGLFEREQNIIAEALSKSSDKEALTKLIDAQRIETGTRRFANDADAQKALNAEAEMAKGHEARLEKASQASALMDQIKTGIQNGKINSRQDIIDFLNKVSATHSKFSTFSQVPDQSAESKSKYMLAKAADVLIKELGGIGKIPFHPEEKVPGINKNELVNGEIETILNEINTAKGSEITDISSLNDWLQIKASPLHDSAIQAIQKVYDDEGDITKLNEADDKTYLRARAAKLLQDRLEPFIPKDANVSALKRNPFEGNPNKEAELDTVLNKLKSSVDGNAIKVEGLPEGEDLTQISTELAKRTAAYHVKESELIENDKQGRLKNSVFSAIRFLAGLGATAGAVTGKGVVTSAGHPATAEALKNSAAANNPAKASTTSTPASTTAPATKLTSRAQIFATLDIAHLKPKFKSMTCYYSGQGQYSATYKEEDFVNPAKLKQIASWLKKDKSISAHMEFTDKDGNNYNVMWSGSNGRFVYSKNTAEEDKVPLSPSEKLLKESSEIYSTDEKKSFNLALEAVKANPANISALVLVATKYRLGEGVKEDQTKAAQYYKKALTINPNQEDSALRLAMIYLDKEKPEIGEMAEAYKLLEIASQSGNKSIREAAKQGMIDNYDAKEIFDWGSSDEKKDLGYAITCYELALKVDPQHGSSALRLGELYLHGKGVKKDLEKAKQLFEIAYNSEDAAISEKAQNLIDKHFEEKEESGD